jgi:rhodanese-related sulfurtransferase
LSTLLTEGNVVIRQVVQDGTTSGAVALTGTEDGFGVSNLAGTANKWTSIGQFVLGGVIQHFWIGRHSDHAGGTVGANGSNSGTDDIYVRIYEFTNVSTGTTLATVIENGTAGGTASTSGTSGTIADAGVTTLGVDRLALNFVGGNDDNALDAFTGMSGGTWVEAVAEYADATGTDAVAGLQTAAMAAAGTIDGGTDAWADATDSWGVVGFALIGTTVVATLVLQPGFVDYNDPGIL